MQAMKESPVEAILSISPVRRDQADLRRILGATRHVIPVASCRHARKRLDEERFPIVLCDGDLPDGTWQDVLHSIAASEHPPLLIVTSRAADDRLWAEVLNRGGFDLLAKPYHPSEVLHVLETARVYDAGPARSKHFAGGA